MQLNQWPFRKTGTMGTLASQAETGVWVEAPGRLYTGKILRSYTQSLANIVGYICGQKMVAMPSIMRF